MATTIGQRLPRQERASHLVVAFAAGAAAALVLACGVGVAVFISQAPATTPGAETRSVGQVHATGRGLQPGLGSYTTSMVGATSQAAGYASGRGGAMEYAGLELPVRASAFSRQRGGILETAEVR